MDAALLVSLLFAALQVVAGLTVAVGAWTILVFGCDHSTSKAARVAFTLILVAGAGLAIEPFIVGGRPTSMAGAIIAAAVGVVLLRHGRQIRGILDGEDWWPPNACRSADDDSRQPR